jgi:hypothetical protein
MAFWTWDKSIFTWDETQLIWELAVLTGGGDFDEEIYKFDAEKKRKIIKLILKVRGMDGDTITEQKIKEIKQYKITAEDIKIVVDKANIELMAENISF